VQRGSRGKEGRIDYRRTVALSDTTITCAGSLVLGPRTRPCCLDLNQLLKTRFARATQHGAAHPGALLLARAQQANLLHDEAVYALHSLTAPEVR
jgi:hypothetical protein